MNAAGGNVVGESAIDGRAHWVAKCEAGGGCAGWVHGRILKVCKFLVALCVFPGNITSDRSQ